MTNFSVGQNTHHESVRGLSAEEQQQVSGGSVGPTWASEAEKHWLQQYGAPVAPLIPYVPHPGLPLLSATGTIGGGGNRLIRSMQLV